MGLNLKRTILLGTVILLAIVAVAGAMRYMREPAPPVHDDAAPMTLQFFKNPSAVQPFRASTIDGRTISSGDWRGKVTILNFWATWCGPCRAEIPELIALQEKYRGQLQVIGISEDEAPVETVSQFVAARKINYPVAMTTPEIDKLFPGISALPTSFIVDREGRIVQKHVGLLDPATTEAETRALAGLPVNASIERVDDVDEVRLKNAAQATEIPGVDLAKLTPAQRAAARQKLNDELCTCGCKLTLAQCRIEDPTCGVSLPLARQVVAAIAAKP